MRLTSALILISVLGQSPNDSADTRELSRLEVAWNTAHVKGDAATLNRLWADDLVVTVPNMPRWNKAQMMQVWRSGHMKFPKYETSRILVHTFGNAAVVTGDLHRTRLVAGRSIDDDWQFTKTYVLGPKGWQVVAYHASDAPKKPSQN
jgi:ketosteroid isomerase-like protein